MRPYDENDENKREIGPLDLSEEALRRLLAMAGNRVPLTSEELEAVRGLVRTFTPEVMKTVLEIVEEWNFQQKKKAERKKRNASIFLAISLGGSAVVAILQWAIGRWFPGFMK